MKAYVEAGVSIDYLFLRSHSGPDLRTASRRGRSPADLARDAEACLVKLRAKHTIITSSLTCFEVEEALYRQLTATGKGVAHRGKLSVPAARAVIPQMLMTFRLFNISVIDLTAKIIREQCANVDLQVHGIRAVDALHVTTALVNDADMIITGDDYIISIDGSLSTMSGGTLRSVDTDSALCRIP
jgi:predicted nucleic acid-binding protein